jgi:hypothetical protein
VRCDVTNGLRHYDADDDGEPAARSIVAVTMRRRDRQGGADHGREDDRFSECRACRFEQRRTRPF